MFLIIKRVVRRDYRYMYGQNHPDLSSFCLGASSQCQGVFNQPSHCRAYRGTKSVCDLVCDFVQVGLDIFETGVENIVHFRLGGHLWQVFVAVYDLNDIDHLLAQLLAHFLPADLPLLLVGQVDNVDLDAPHFPGNTLVRKRPARLLLLVELQGDLPHAIAASDAQRILEFRHSSPDPSVQLLRGHPDKGEIDEVTVDVECAHGTYGVGALLFVVKFTGAAMQ